MALIKNKFFAHLTLFFIAIVCILMQPLVSATEKEISCDALGFVSHEDPKGLGLRDTPTGNIVTQIPNNAEFEIKRYRSGWMLITNISYSAQHKKYIKKHKKILELEDGWVYLKSLSGWVPAKKLGTYIRSYDPEKSYWLTANAKLAGEKVIRITEMSPLVNLRACKGRWLQVEYKKTVGWLSPGLNCPSPFTSCS